MIIADAITEKINDMHENKRRKVRKDRLLVLIREISDGFQSMPSRSETLTGFLVLNGQPQVTGRGNKNTCPQKPEELLENINLMSDLIAPDVWNRLRGTGEYIIGLPGMTAFSGGEGEKYSAVWMLRNLLSGLLKNDEVHLPLKKTAKGSAGQPKAALDEILDAFFRNGAIFPAEGRDGESAALEYLLQTGAKYPYHRAEAAFAFAKWAANKGWSGAAVGSWLLTTAVGEPTLPEEPPGFVLESLRRNKNLAVNILDRFLTSVSESVTENAGVGFEDITVSGAGAFVRRIGRSFVASVVETLSEEGHAEEAERLAWAADQIYERSPDAALSDSGIRDLWTEAAVIAAELYAERYEEARREMARQAVELLEDADKDGRFLRREFRHKWVSAKKVAETIIKHDGVDQGWDIVSKGF